MTGYRVPADSAAEVDHVVDQELLAVAMAEAGQLEAFAAVEAFEAYDSPGALAPPTAPNPSTPVHASELDAAQGWAAREAEGLDATAAGDSGRSVSGVVIEDLPDIPEVPFSVRVASMWGAAMPAPSRPAEDEADEAGFGHLRKTRATPYGRTVPWARSIPAPSCSTRRRPGSGCSGSWSGTPVGSFSG